MIEDRIREHDTSATAMSGCGIALMIGVVIVFALFLWALNQPF